MTSPGDWDVDTILRLRSVISKLSRQLNASAADEGLTPTQASVLGLIVNRGPLSRGALAEIEGLNPTMLSRIVGRLDEAGLIRRMPEPTDLRTAWVEATAEGRRTNRRVKDRRAVAVRDHLERLTPDQRASLLEALAALESLAGIPPDPAR